MSLCVGGNPATRRRDWNQYRLVAYVARYRFLILFDAMAIKFFALQLQLHTYYSRRLSDRILGSCAHHWAAFSGSTQSNVIDSTLSAMPVTLDQAGDKKARSAAE